MKRQRQRDTRFDISVVAVDASEDINTFTDQEKQERSHMQEEWQDKTLRYIKNLK